MLREDLAGDTRQPRLPFEPIETRMDAQYREWRESPRGERIVGEVLHRISRLRERGFRRFGIGAIWEAIRYDWAISGVDKDGFKLNDHWRSRVARELMLDYPHLAGFFETRELKS